MFTTHSIAQQSETIAEEGDRTVELTFLHTSDVHGSIFSYDYLKQKATSSGLPFVFSAVDSLRKELGDRLIVTDGGDCLQGQPTAYYYNFVDTVSPHLIAEVMNQMGYVCSVMGNHDVEAGHPVYDRWVRDLRMPVLGANVVDVRTGKPYLTPYIIITRAGVRIALLGMVTPGIPFWLPQNLWKGLRFDDIESSCRQWAKAIQDAEHPDLLVGIFHSGFNGGIDNELCKENAAEQVARTVPGFDLILYGHDHHAAIHEVECVDGRKVMCMAPTSDAQRYVRADVSLRYRNGKIAEKRVVPSLPFVNPQHTGNHDLVAQLFEAEFVDQRLTLGEWVNRKIGELTRDMDGMDAYFGPSLFIDFIHQMQLDLTGADVSLAAPLSYDAIIKAGPMTVSDMFSLYKYENFLYTMRLTGRELKGLLEMSYGQWVNQMHSPDDHVMLLKPNANGSMFFANMTFNFESAAGILYTVDVTRPIGQRITISSMADGTPFSLDREYRVAVNSYRGNGGGELLTEGAGIPREELSSRIITSTGKDLRYLMMQRIQSLGTVTPHLLNHWRFVPEEWVAPASQRDRAILQKQ